MGSSARCGRNQSSTIQMECTEHGVAVLYTTGTCTERDELGDVIRMSNGKATGAVYEQ